jgi:hypothetical protein
MATKTLNVAAFTAKLLAPLPAAETQVADKLHLRVISEDMQRVWDLGMAHVKLAHSMRDAAWYAFVIAGKRTSGPEYAAYCALMNAVGEKVGRQLMIPAPRMKELRWKRDAKIGWKLTAEGLAAIERDEVRLAPKKEG